VLPTPRYTKADWLRAGRRSIARLADGHAARRGGRSAPPSRWRPPTPGWSDRSIATAVL